MGIYYKIKAMTINQEKHQNNYDIAIIGASLAGSTAATFFARHGLKVALIERKTNPLAYKKICTHFLQPSAIPVLKQLDVISSIEAVGAVSSRVENWTKWGWIRPDGYQKINPLPHGYNIQRKKLDPIVRNVAITTPGVDFISGYKAYQLLKQNNQINGIVIKNKNSQIHQIKAKLVVGADGRNSSIAKLANLKTKTQPNKRFVYLVYYRNLPLKSGTNTQFWFLQPEVAYALPNNDGLTLLACFLPDYQLETFKQDLLGNFVRFFENLPEGPPIHTGERVSEIMGVLDLCNITRTTVTPGLALIGDAAMTADPIWGIGCGWAFQSAEWLVDCTAQVLLNNGNLNQALLHYQKTHKLALRGHYYMISSFSKRFTFNWLERLYTKAAVKDPIIARYLHAIGARLIRTRDLFAPSVFARVLRMALS